MARRPSLCVVLFVLAAPTVRAEVIERILATVDGRPAVRSEARVLARLRGLSEAAALEALIEERLMYREAGRLPQAAVSPEAEARALASLRERAGAAAAELPEAELRRLARRQAAILAYVEFRFLPQVRVEEDAVRRAYEAEYAGREDAPPLEQAAPALRARLHDADLDARIEAWVRELRASAQIRYNSGP